MNEWAKQIGCNLTPEGVAFYDRSLKLYERLSAELNFNIMFSQRGHMTLAHNDSSLRTMRWRAEVNKLQGIDSEVITPEEIKKLAPPIDEGWGGRFITLQDPDKYRFFFVTWAEKT